MYSPIRLRGNDRVSEKGVVIAARYSFGLRNMAKKTWRLASNHRPHMYDGVEVTKEDVWFTVYRYIDDTDEEGDTVYSIEEYLKYIPEQIFKREINAASDNEVIKWLRAHLIKRQSNSIDAIIAFLDEHHVPYEYEATV